MSVDQSKNVVEFIRVSTKEQANDDRVGILRQKETNENTVQKFDLTVIESLIIKDVSGASVLHTPEVKKMVDLMNLSFIVGIVVADWDRLIRPDNYDDFSLLQRIRETNTFLFINSEKHDLNSQTGFLMGGFQSIMSGNELVQIKKRMLEAKEIKRKRGELPTNVNTLPLGVEYDRTKKEFRYNDDISKIKRLFKLFYYDGIRNFSELEELTSMHHRTIANRLKNKLYIGFRYIDEKRETKKRTKADGRQAEKKKVKRNPDEIIDIKVIDKPAIEPHIFEEIQKILKNKNREYHRKRPAGGERYLYSGFLRCGICGKRMYTNSGGRKHKKDYYYCKSKNHLQVKKQGPSNCNSRYLPKEVVEPSVTSFLSEKLISRDYVKSLINKAFSESDSVETQAKLNSIQQELEKMKRKRSRILDLYIDGYISKTELNKKASVIITDICLLEDEVSGIERIVKTKDISDLEEVIQLICQTLLEFKYWNSKQKRAFLRRQIPEIFLTKKGVTNINLNLCKIGNHTGRDSLLPPA